MWLSNADCKRVVAETWNVHVFGNFHHIVKNVLANVASIQASINSSGHDQDLLDQENLIQKELLQALAVEKNFWKEKLGLTGKLVWIGTQVSFIK
ncbi:hypothetical protein Lal_00022279 [Lupinus albus]|nr:hypothetical protein Lal_00022279 [Lupinus albus]